MKTFNERGELLTAGSTGAAGENGSRWYVGSGPPSSLLGVEYDFYLDIDTGDVFEKVDVSESSAEESETLVWVYQGNIKGADGTNGTNGIDGDSFFEEDSNGDINPINTSAKLALGGTGPDYELDVTGSVRASVIYIAEGSTSIPLNDRYTFSQAGTIQGEHNESAFATITFTKNGSWSDGDSSTQDGKIILTTKKDGSLYYSMTLNGNLITFTSGMTVHVPILVADIWQNTQVEISYASSITFDPSDGSCQYVNVTGDLEINIGAISPGTLLKIYLFNDDTSDHALTFVPSLRWFSAMPTQISAGKIGILTMEAISTEITAIFKEEEDV